MRCVASRFATYRKIVTVVTGDTAPAKKSKADFNARWAQDHAVSEVLGLDSFDEDDLYAALDDRCARQEKIERALYQQYQHRCGTQPPRLFLYDVTSSYLEIDEKTTVTKLPQPSAAPSWLA